MLQEPRIPYYFALIGGILIILSGLITFLIFFMVGFSQGHVFLAGLTGVIFGKATINILLGLSACTIICGIVVLVMTLLTDRSISQSENWGILIILFSFLSLFGGGSGGFFAGALLGMIGGVGILHWEKLFTSRR